MPSRRRAPAAGSSPAAAAAATRILKKYPNRRLYDTQTSSYVTLTDVKKMVLSGEDFEVRDAKTGEDLTRSILLQIILEEESGGVPMFTAPMLSQIIRFYGDAMQGMMGDMLAKNLQSFAEMQQRFMGPGLVDAKALTPEAWTAFMGGQSPLMQNWMSGYAEQMRDLVQKMQQANPLFPSAPGDKKR